MNRTAAPSCFQTSDFQSATVLSCRKSNSHRRSGRDTDSMVLSGLTWRCELAVTAFVRRCNSALVIDTACIVCGAGSMKLSGVRPSVCLSVCPTTSVPSLAAARRCGGFAAVGPAGRRYRSIAARPALSSNCEQCHVVSGRRKLNRRVYSFRRWRIQYLDV